MYSQRKKNGVDAAYVPMFHGGIPMFKPNFFLQNEKSKMLAMKFKIPFN